MIKMQDAIEKNKDKQFEDMVVKGKWEGVKVSRHGFVESEAEEKWAQEQADKFWYGGEEICNDRHPKALESYRSMFLNASETGKTMGKPMIFGTAGNVDQRDPDTIKDLWHKHGKEMGFQWYEPPGYKSSNAATSQVITTSRTSSGSTSWINGNTIDNCTVPYDPSDIWKQPYRVYDYHQPDWSKTQIQVPIDMIKPGKVEEFMELFKKQGIVVWQSEPKTPVSIVDREMTQDDLLLLLLT